MARVGNRSQHLSLSDVTRLAVAAARAEDPHLEVIAATGAGGEDSSEVLVTLAGCAQEPCRVLLRVDRTADEEDLIPVIRARLRAHVEEHRGHANE